MFFELPILILIFDASSDVFLQHSSLLRRSSGPDRTVLEFIWERFKRALNHVTSGSSDGLSGPGQREGGSSQLVLQFWLFTAASLCRSLSLSVHLIAPTTVFIAFCLVSHTRLNTLSSYVLTLPLPSNLPLPSLFIQLHTTQYAFYQIIHCFSCLPCAYSITAG